MVMLSPPVAPSGASAAAPQPPGMPNPAAVALRSQSSAFAETTPPHGVCATCRGPVIVRARYDDYWRTPLTMAPLRVEDLNGVVFDGDISTQGLAHFGALDGDVTAERLGTLRSQLGFVEASDAQRGPLAVEIVATPADEAAAANLERDILSDLRGLARQMQTAIQPWVDEWEARGIRGAFGRFLSGIGEGLDSWLQGEGEFWSAIGEWLSNVPDMAADVWNGMTTEARRLWDNRQALLDLLASLARGEVNVFQRALEALRPVFAFAIKGVGDMAELMNDVIDRSAEWAQGMNELARRTDVLSVFGATALGILAAIPPNFWSDVVGRGLGFLIPEAIIAILLSLLAAFTGGTGAGPLAARLTAFAAGIKQRLASLGEALTYFARLLDGLAGIVEKIKDLIRRLMSSRRQRASGQTDQEIPIVRPVRRHDVPCFDLPRGADAAEFDRQLREQMDAINRMTADDMAYSHYVLDQARAEHARQVAAGTRRPGSAFTDLLRDNGAQRRARDSYRRDLIRQGYDDDEIAELMGGVDATHFLDIVAGGNPSSVGIGGAAENRGIGRQWIGQDRAEGLGQAARSMRQEGLADRRMNVNLERCR